jgi:hypothetical protein
MAARRRVRILAERSGRIRLAFAAVIGEVRSGHSAAIDALERNAWSLFGQLGSGEGGTITDTPTRLVVETPVPQPPYNTVWRFYAEPSRPLANQVAELLERFDARGVAMMWLVHPTTDPAVRDELARQGLVCAEQIYGMIADLSDLPAVPALPEGVDVGEASPADRSDWFHLVSWRYGLDTSTSTYLGEVFTRVLQRTTRMWMARVDGVPASKTALHVDAHGVAGIYGVATTERGRNRGLASLLTLTALHNARDAGVTTAVLHSTPMARSMYRRLGFEDVAVFEAWARPDTVHL